MQEESFIFLLGILVGDNAALHADGCDVFLTLASASLTYLNQVTYSLPLTKQSQQKARIQTRRV